MIFTASAEAATFTSKAAGNWNAEGQTTWNEAGSPVAGDDVTISHAVTLAADAACANITIASGGTLSAGAYTITASGNWDSSAGTFTYGTSTVNLTGTGNFLATGDSFYNLTMAAAGKTTTLQGNAVVRNVATLGTGTLTGEYMLSLTYGVNPTTPLVNNGATVSIDKLQYHRSGDNTVTISGGTYTLTNGLHIVGEWGNNTYNLGGNITVVGVIKFRPYTWGGTTDTINTNNYTISTTGLTLGSSSGDLGTINFGSSTVTLGTSGLDVTTSGTSFTLNLQTSNISCAGNWELVDGTGTVTQNASTSTVIFNGTGTQNITSNSQSFYKLVIEKDSGSAVLQDAIDINNNFNINWGTFDANGKNQNVAGNFNLGGTAGGIYTKGGTLTFDGTTTINDTSTTKQNLGTVVVAGTVTLGSNISADSLTINSTKSLTTSASNYSITTTGNITVNGTLTANGSTITCGGSWDSSAGTFTYGTSTVTMTGTTKNLTMNSSSYTLYKLTINSGANVTDQTGVTIADSGTLTVTGTFVIASGKTFNVSSLADLTVNSGGTLTITGLFRRALTDSSNHITNSGTISGAGSWVWRFIGTSTAAKITATNYGTCNIYLRRNNVTVVTGVIGRPATDTTSTFVTTGNLYLYDNDASGDGNGGTFTIDNSASNIAFTVANLEVGGASTSVNGTCTLTAGSATYTVSGNFTVNTSSTLTAGTSTVTFNGTSSQTVTSNSQSFYNLRDSNTSASVSLADNATLLANGTLTVDSSATLNLNTKTFTILSTASISNSGTITETSTAKIVHAATSCLLTDSSGNEKATYNMTTDSIYVRVVDEDENLSGTSADTLVGITVTGGTNGDSETLTLTETGNATEIFLSSALATAVYAAPKTNNDGTLQLSDGETITVTYTDDEDSTDTATDTATGNTSANFLVSVSSPQTAATSFTYTITARNADGTTDTSYSGTANITSTYVSPTSGTKTLSTTSTSSWTNGVATISETYNDAGVITITATDASVSTITGTSSNITFVPNSFTLSTSKTTFSVNEPFTLTITAKNSAGTTTANYKGASTLSINYVTPSTNQSGSLSTSTLTGSSWSSGVYTLSSFTYNKFGIITITCKDPTNTNKTGTSAQLTFLPLKLEVSPTSPSGGRDFYYSGEDIATTVTAKDYNGSTIANYASTVGFSGTNLNLPSNYSFSSSDSGTHIFSDISATAKGTTSLTATDTTYSAATGTSSEFKVKEGTIRVYDTSGSPGTLPVKVGLIDSDGNDITNDSGTAFTVTLSESVSDNTASSSAESQAATFYAGEAEIEVSDDQVETVTVTPVSEDYLDVIAGKVIFGGKGAPKFGSGTRVLWWRELRQDEEKK